MAEVHRIGFTPLLGDEKNVNRGPYGVNIVLIHGLRGHPKRTSLFRAKSSKSTTSSVKSDEKDSTSPRIFWPVDFLAEDIPEARMWTYGYDADVIGGVFQANNKNSVSQHGRDLAVRIEREIDNKDPIFFVAHSLGGIILKDAMHRSESCRTRTRLIVFLGTPHRGSAVAGWGEIAANLARLALQDSNKRLLETLEIHSFQEAQGVSGMKGLDNKVVDDFSSKLDLPRELETVESINANHRQMTKCGNRSDPQYRAILGVLKQAASSLSLGNLPVQMTLRQRRRIPYLTSPNWFEAVQYLGSTWEGETRDGLDVAGTYSESWMNLFMNFGAHNILTSRFVQSLPVDEYDVPQDIVNPFAVQLTVLAKLVGIIGCDGLEYVDDMPVFTGTRTRLEFRRDGHKAWIGRFTQEPGLSTYMFGNWMTVGKASIHAGGCVLYRLGIVIPLLETQAMEQPPCINTGSPA
ncbi:hypothetical protein ACCO45_004365 [Purpureocillium lilacinum]|uniref:Uncharacterized protein n=1 Tax=Purpureocillium lilacinum TaxID=33203 RepID=A0ACC4E2L1_PURLI